MSDFYFNKVLQDDSSLYFSVRKLKPNVREAVTAVMAFYKEIEDITLNYKDLTVAQAKLHWWRNEVIKIQDGKPDHPIALKLQHCLRLLHISPLRFMDMIDGLEQNLAFLRFEKFEDVVIHIMRTAGKRELLIADILLGKEQVETEVIYQFALVIELTHYIQHLRRYVQCGLIYFSEDELQTYQVAEMQLQNYVTTDAIRQLLAFQAEKIERSYFKAQQSLSPQTSLLLSNLIIRSKIARANLKEIAKANYTVLESFIRITPLRCWWIANF